MRRLLLLLPLAALTAGCAGLSGGKDEAVAEFDRDTGAADLRVKEDKARSSLGKIEASLADYVKFEKGIPKRLDSLVPKYLAEVPSLDLPACGRETDKVEYYLPDVLRDGRVDGTRLNGTGRWGYVHSDRQVVVFIDCLKPSGRGVPWYQERGVY